jgi:hypothetical protein
MRIDTISDEEEDTCEEEDTYNTRMRIDTISYNVCVCHMRRRIHVRRRIHTIHVYAYITL